MNRSYIGRVVGMFVVAAGMLLGLFAGTASAQVVDRGPAQILVTDAGTRANPDGSASSARVGTAVQAHDGVSAAACGYWTRWEGGNQKSYYTHCGNYGIQIRIKFGTWWPDYADAWVLPGTTNLSDHWISWGKRHVTGAWCISNC